MSQGFDYSKFDNMSDQCADAESKASMPLSSKNDKGVVKQGSHPNRYVFEYDGQQIYEWEQSLEEVSLRLQHSIRLCEGVDEQTDDPVFLNIQVQEVLSVEENADVVGTVLDDVQEVVDSDLEV